MISLGIYSNFRSCFSYYRFPGNLFWIKPIYRCEITRLNSRLILQRIRWSDFEKCMWKKKDMKKRVNDNGRPNHQIHPPSPCKDFSWLNSGFEMPKAEHSSISYSLSSIGVSNDDGLEGCVLICTDRKSAALRKSAEWQISLGEDGIRPSVSEPLGRGWEQPIVLTFPCKGYELVEGAEVKPFAGLWYRYGETGLVGRLSEWDKQVLIIASRKISSHPNLRTSMNIAKTFHPWKDNKDELTKSQTTT